ncbi:MAG: hypothetical protein A4E37_02125 [Methanoregulaceae archaeon PtaB.Bin056]|jgi:hypothetical protein|nr:MAG: hypothetical protein A4E37_02125 [Methanoregulaceae archaeon PtaB.Bin056]
MDKVKVLLVLLALSLGGNIFLVMSASENQFTGGVGRSLMYAYHQAFPPLENTTEDLEESGNATSAHGVNATVDEGESVEEDPSLRDILLRMDEEGILDEEHLLMLLADREWNTSVEPPEVSAEPEPTPDPNAWREYSSTKWRFSIPYPPTWEIKEGSGSSPAVTLSAPAETECSSQTTECYQYIASLTVSIDQKPETIVLEDYFNKKVSKLQKDLAITATSKSAPTTLSGNKAYWIEYYTRDSRGNPSKTYMQYFTILDKKVYILTYSGPYSTSENVYSRNKPDVEKMIKEFVVEREYRAV